jgi:hypothetical protein
MQAVEKRHQGVVVVGKADGIGDLNGLDDVEPAADEKGAGLIRQGHRLLRRKLVPLDRWVVPDVPARRLIDQPLADITLVHPGVLGKLRWCHPAGAQHGFIQPEFLPDVHQRRAQGRAEIVEHFTQECV